VRLKGDVGEFDIPTCGRNCGGRNSRKVNEIVERAFGSACRETPVSTERERKG
jgi:hypothetical protein